MSPPVSRHSLTSLVMIVGLLTAVRFAVLFITPLELYPDEAQYWLWSRDLAFGYYSKPPMLAWLIALTTGIGGDQEPWVRFASPLLHAAAALMLYQAGRRLYDARTGWWAGLLYILMPGVMLSAGIASTDAPLLFFMSMTLWAYVAFVERPGWRSALAFGLAVGGAFLSKYAALYALLGVGLHLALSADARRAWFRPTALAAPAGLAIAATPNLIWNAFNDFSTVSHTAANADWHWGDLFHPAEVLEFLVSQFGVFGPVTFTVLLIGVGLMAVRRRLPEPRGLLLLVFALTPLALVTVQALLSRANANWAAVAYPAAILLVAAWLVGADARRWLFAAVVTQVAIGALFMIFVADPAIADRLGAAGSFKRVRGWEASTAVVLDAAEALGPRTVVAADDRFLFNAIAYYGRDRLAARGGPVLRMWVREAHAQNQAETTDPLTAGDGQRVLMASVAVPFRSEFAADFRRFSGWTEHQVRIDPDRTRDVATGVGETYARRPRDPITGEPLPVSPTRP